MEEALGSIPRRVPQLFAAQPLFTSLATSCWTEKTLAHPRISRAFNNDRFRHSLCLHVAHSLHKLGPFSDLIIFLDISARQYWNSKVSIDTLLCKGSSKKGDWRGLCRGVAGVAPIVPGLEQRKGALSTNQAQPSSLFTFESNLKKVCERFEQNLTVKN